jgi:peptide/nickel transport system permease protein
MVQPGESDRMVRYILQRFVGMAVVMFLVVTIVFVIVRVTPGDPAAVMLGPDASAQDIADLRARLGLDQSLVIQYFYYIGQLLKGDLGQSIFLNMPVGAALLDRAEPTFFLTVLSLLIACIIALPVGVYAAYRRGSFVDQAATTVAMLAASIPSFWLGLILMQFFAVRLNLFPVFRLWRAGFELHRSNVPSDPASHRAGAGFLRSDPAFHARLNA